MAKQGMWIVALLTIGCGGDSGQTDSGEMPSQPATEVCSGPGCVNATECPMAEPDDGGDCDFAGNCHYCDNGDDTSARGYTCDGTSFSAQGTFDCTTK